MIYEMLVEGGPQRWSGYIYVRILAKSGYAGSVESVSIEKSLQTRHSIPISFHQGKLLLKIYV